MDRIKPNRQIPLPTHFGKNLKFLRRLMGLTQEELAKRLNASRNNIASYESGMVEPNIERFLRTCTFFNVSPRDMLESILSEKPSDANPLIEDPSNVLGQYLTDHMEQFVIQTNEMTKVLEGYKLFLDMKKENENYNLNADLFTTLSDLLDLLRTLIKSNWNLIQSIYPDYKK